MSGSLAELTLLVLLGVEVVFCTGLQVFMSSMRSPRTSGRTALACTLAIYLTMAALMIANLTRLPDTAAAGAIALVSLIPAGAWGVLALVLHLGVMAVKRRAPRTTD